MLMKKRRSELIKKNPLPIYLCWTMALTKKSLSDNSKSSRKKKLSIRNKCRGGYSRTMEQMRMIQTRKEERKESDGVLMSCNMIGKRKE